MHSTPALPKNGNYYNYRAIIITKREHLTLRFFYLWSHSKLLGKIFDASDISCLEIPTTINLTGNANYFYKIALATGSNEMTSAKIDANLVNWEWLVILFT